MKTGCGVTLVIFSISIVEKPGTGSCGAGAPARVSARCDASADHHHRRSWQLVEGVIAAIQFRMHDRPIRISRAVRIRDDRRNGGDFSVRHEASARRVPLVLGAAESGDLDWPHKTRSRIRLPRKRAAKCNPHPVTVLLSAI